MINLALQNGDLYLEGGQIATVTKGAEVAQTLKNRLSTFYGEYFLDQTYGVVYIQTLQNKASFDALNLSLRGTIAGTKGVASIDSFQTSLDRINRIYRLDASVTTTYSDQAQISQNYGV
jgi:hypothetical protein